MGDRLTVEWVLAVLDIVQKVLEFSKGLVKLVYYTILESIINDVRHGLVGLNASIDVGTEVLYETIVVSEIFFNEDTKVVCLVSRSNHHCCLRTFAKLRGVLFFGLEPRQTLSMLVVLWFGEGTDILRDLATKVCFQLLTSIISVLQRIVQESGYQGVLVVGVVAQNEHYRHQVANIGQGHRALAELILVQQGRRFDGLLYLKRVHTGSLVDHTVGISDCLSHVPLRPYPVNAGGLAPDARALF